MWFAKVHACISSVPVRHLESDRDGPWYEMCGIDGCRKKVLDEGDGLICRTHGIRPGHAPQPSLAWVLFAHLGDHTSGLAVSMFDNVGRKLIGASADEVYAKYCGITDLAARREAVQAELQRMRLQNAVFVLKLTERDGGSARPSDGRYAEQPRVNVEHVDMADSAGVVDELRSMVA